ncbi:MAG: class I SAM-dependent methyltransferase, partial [Pseudomonadota bacterium]
MTAEAIPMAPASRFWDKIAEKYARQPVADEAAYQKKLEVTREYFNPEMEVVELGCGTGSTAIAHAPYVRRIRAYDISPKMIDIAKGKAQDAAIDNVEFEVAGLEELTLPDGSADAVLALSLLHLVEDRDAAIARVRRVLKPGGVFITNTACIGDTMPYFRLIGPIGRALGIMPLVKVFTQKDLVRSFEDGG